MCAERRQSFEAAVGRIPVRRSAAGCRELSLPALLGIHAARLGCLLRRSCGGFGTDRARFRAGHSITLVQRDFTGDAALGWGCAGLRFSDRGALRFRVSGKYQGETHNKTQDQTHSDHSKTLCNDLRVHRATLVVLTGRTREKLTKVVSQFDQERSLIHVSDMTKPDPIPDLAATAIALK